MCDAVSGRILVVDDEPSLLKLVARYLTRLGFVVVTANTADSGWDKFQAEPLGFDLAIIDLTLEGMSGMELSVRILEATPGIRVMAMSGYPTGSKEIESKAPGRVSFLLKPFSPELLASAVTRAIQPRTCKATC